MHTNFWTNFKKPILALAPMEGVTDSAYRTICKRYGADVVYTEFVAAEALMRDIPIVLKKLKFREEERPVVAQIFGKTPESFAAAAKKVEQLGFDGVDLNFGCPARKVVNHGSGVALLRNPKFARQLIEAVLAQVTIPLSIKVRVSIRKERVSIDPNNDEIVTAVDLVNKIKDLPIAAMMVHGRSFEQGHSGTIDNDMIRQVKQEFPGLVLANGGINTPEEATAVLASTGVDGVGLARGTFGQPWIFQQIKKSSPVDWDFIKRVALEHAELAFADKGQHGIMEFRKHLAWYFRGRPGARAMRLHLADLHTVGDVAAVFKKFNYE